MPVQTPLRPAAPVQQQLQLGLSLLNSGRPGQALALARQLQQHHGHHPQCRLLLAMALADSHQHGQAMDAFNAAADLASEPLRSQIRLNQASWLARIGRPGQALELIQTASPGPDTLLLQARLQARCDRPETARVTYERLIALPSAPADAWRGLAELLQRQYRLADAQACLQDGLKHHPDHPALLLALASTQRLRGQAAQALQSVDRLLHNTPGHPAAQDLRNGLLLEMGQPARALEGARTLVRQHPDHRPGLETLANILWEHGPHLAPGEEPLGALFHALSRHPGDRDLRLQMARLLMGMKRFSDVLDVLASLPDSDATAQWFRADALASLGENLQAEAHYRSAQRALSALPAFCNARARHALRCRQPAAAQDHAQAAIAADADNQEAWSLLSLAWRLLDDPRQHWLCDVDRLVGHVPVQLDDGHGHNALPLLQQHLLKRHHAAREPLSQSVRQGSQTPGRLFGGEDALLARTEQALQQAVQQWVRGLPDDPTHPFLRRKSRQLAIVGSWSVCLRRHGHHANHIHSQGWLSSAFHVALPAAIGQPADDHAGWLQIGRPLDSLGVDLPVQRWIRPQPGWLALFPSCFWHGTEPFEDETPRLTIAFDMQPLR